MAIIRTQCESCKIISDMQSEGVAMVESITSRGVNYFYNFRCPIAGCEQQNFREASSAVVKALGGASVKISTVDWRAEIMREGLPANGALDTNTINNFVIDLNLTPDIAGAAAQQPA